jgi:hypothetical protein
MQGFENWYKMYPRKEAKINAEKAYTKAVKNGVSHEKLMEGLTRFNAHLESQPREKKFIPLPASWLNAGRWEDEYQDKSSGGCLTGAQVLKWQSWIQRGMPIPKDMVPILRANGVLI